MRLGADGLSLQLVNGARVHTFNRGFSERISAIYATISAQAELPGPATLRYMEAQYFESHEIVGARYPKSVGIDAGSRFSAAACLPLVVEGEGAALCYLALHYRGTRDLMGSHPRLSNETNIKVNKLSRALVQRAAVQGLPQDERRP